MKKLCKKAILSVDTVLTNRKGSPEITMNNNKLKRGEFMFIIQRDVCAILWQNSKPVTLMATAFTPSSTTFVNRKLHGAKTAVL